MLFLLRKLFQAAMLLAGVALISFILFQYLGDPVANMLPESATEVERMQLRASLGLNDPVFIQFLHYISRLLHGNFGISYYNQVSVFQLIMERLPATLELVFVAVVISLAVGFPLGVWVAITRNKILRESVQILSLIGVSLPWFLIGIMLIIVFSVWLGWFPSSGRGETVKIGFWSSGLLTASGWRSIVLPALSLALSMITIIMRLVRTEMLEVMKADYIKFARARGIENYRIWFRHALRNALLPVVTVIGLQIGGLIAFAIVIETVFQWPGMGLLLIQSINYVDVPVLSGYLLFIALIFIVINTIVDLLYYLIDPRMRAQ
ncbi:ABC transporter permease [Raoultella terrigena]|jgi:peptide/nickel transport system permease protein|uniref:ABC transporter permease n=1 Tax=Raoultella terrigena TaxID=577 RepID=A0A1V2BIC3_RAOTE|nr:ABC transporter permease [Raoultella terrigena]AJF73176.1 ABC transporter permease [Raoultella ornithinolytica]HCR57995.1 ABC transporter permease [Raoultella sp.]MEB8193251.1 ABC transporter permease [Raoultella terrigena]OMP91624.1 ABC transporter permease [Raoultella terrigena]QPF11275.1 ABC transporter permease [Raoultella terrigena]